MEFLPILAWLVVLIGVWAWVWYQQAIQEVLHIHLDWMRSCNRSLEDMEKKLRDIEKKLYEKDKQ